VLISMQTSDMTKNPRKLIILSTMHTKENAIMTFTTDVNIDRYWLFTNQRLLRLLEGNQSL